MHPFFYENSVFQHSIPLYPSDHDGSSEVRGDRLSRPMDQGACDGRGQGIGSPGLGAQVREGKRMYGEHGWAESSLRSIDQRLYLEL